MLIKRYVVNNMNEAMTRIRYELGKDAVIISQRKIRRPGIKGFFSPKLIEVTAAIENNSKKSKTIEPKQNNLEDSIESIKKLMEKEINIEQKKSGTLANVNNEIEERISSQEALRQTNLSSEKSASNNNTLLNEMHEMKSMISKLANKGFLEEKEVFSEEQTKMIEVLKKNDVEEHLINDLLEGSTGNTPDLKSYISAKLEDKVEISETVLEGAVVLVGPTGVGKTTTIAKLAGRLALMEKKKVGLITVDTYRIGAVEQLKTYAEIMNLPFKVVITLKEMEEAVKEMSNCDVILIDTTGRSSKNSMQISELRAFIQKVNTTNIHLVISATTKNKDIESIVEGFNILSYNNIIITKLDETSVYGSILNILEIAKKPVSYLTTGQNVPDDIRSFSKKEVIKLILGEEGIC